MEEMQAQETYVNPLQIKCEGCGAPAEYDIIHQNYHCQFCGMDTDLYAPVKALERYRSLHERELKAKTQKDNYKRYNCPNCGAIVVLDTTEATADCGFCGTKMVNSNFVESDSFPELIIPFKLNEEEAQGQLHKWIEDNKGTEEAKALANRIKELKGYYLPYQMVKGPIRCNITRARSFRKYECGGFVEEVAVNTSRQLDNMLLDSMEPFDWRELQPFKYGYIAGQRTKLEDSTPDQIKYKIEEEMANAYLSNIEKVMETKDLSASTKAEGVLCLPAVLPVYVISTGKVKAAVNGQTGRVAVSPIKKTVVHRRWVEPLLLLLLVAGLCEAVPLLFGYHASFELSAMISGVAALITYFAYQDSTNVEKVVYLKSAKQLAKRMGNKLQFVDGAELKENPALMPVFFEKLNNVVEPVVIKFFTTARWIKIFAFIGFCLFMPSITAALVVAYDYVMYSEPWQRFFELPHVYAAAWWTLFVPIMYIIYIQVIRSQIYDYPIMYRILPDGSLKKVEGLYNVSILGIVKIMFAPPVLWVTLFILFMLFGCTGAILS